MKAIDLVKVLSNVDNDFGEFAVVEDSFRYATCYIDWLSYVLEHRLGISTLEKDVNKVYRGRGYDKIRKYITNRANKTLIIYGYLKNYTSSAYTISVDTKKCPVEHMAGDILITVETYKSSPDDAGKYFECGYVVELLK